MADAGRILVQSLPFKCNVCHQRFGRKIQLEHHMRGHTGERPFSCSYCPMAFRDSTRKRVHERVHTGERPYQCPHCEKAFATSSHLKNHIRCHTGERPYRCRYPNCSKLFSTASSLSSHVRTHPPNLKPENCQQIASQPEVTKFKIMPSQNGMSYRLVPISGLDNFQIITKSGKTIKPAKPRPPDYGEGVSILNDGNNGSSMDDYVIDNDQHQQANSNGISEHSNADPAHQFLDVEFMEDNDDQHEELPDSDDGIPSKLVIDEEYASNSRTTTSNQNSNLLFELQKPVKPAPKKIKKEMIPDYRCDKCGESFKIHSAYRQHVQGHEEKPFPCSTCGDAFNNLQELISHRAVHSLVNKKRYCPYCNKPFAYNNKPEMDQHVMEHKKIHSVRFKPDNTKKTGDKSTVFPHSDYLQVLRNGLSKLPKSATVFKKLDCPYCSKIYIIEEDLKAHLQTHLPQPQLKKTIPKKPMKMQVPIPTEQSQKLLKELTPSADKPFSCSMCPLQFRLHSTLIVHERRHRNESPYTCEYCKQQFGTTKDLEAHSQVHTNAAKQFKCTLCAKRFGLPSLLRRHMVMQHKITHNIAKNPGLMQIQCKSSPPRKNSPKKHEHTPPDSELINDIQIMPIVQTQTSTSSSAMMNGASTSNYPSGLSYLDGNEHSDLSDSQFSQGSTELMDVKLLGIENGDEGEDEEGDQDGQIQYECPYCPKICKQNTELKAHVRSHTGERPFGCDFCGKRFTQRGHLTMHIRIHTGEKPYRCPYCLRQFNQHSNLKSHLEVHKKAQEHVCSFCNLSCGSLSKIRAHMITHSQDAALLCQRCNRQFSRKADLMEHMSTHTSDKPFVCSYCNKRFTRRTHLTIHEKSHEVVTDDQFETVQITISKQTTYSCYHCDINFPSVQDLQAHALEHPENERMQVFMGNRAAQMQSM